MKIVYTLTEEQVKKLKTLQDNISKYIYLSRAIIAENITEDSVIFEVFDKINELCQEMESVLAKES